MGETVQPPAVIPATDAPAQVTGASLERDQFVETFTVREKGRKYEVATNAVANRALMQMNVAKLRSLIERAIKPYEDHPELVPSPKDLKTLVEAVQTVDSMSDIAYSDKKAGGLANSLERLVYAATRGAAAGSSDSKSTPSGNSPGERLKRLNNIGKRTVPTPVATPKEQVIELDD